MGLASSQARLLTLTARMHQIEYKAARLEAMKLQMANESRQVYEEYLDALDKTKVQIKTLNTDGSITYKDITNYQTDFLDAGYALDFNGVVYDGRTVKVGSDGKTYEATDTIPTGVTTTDKVLNFQQLCADAYGATSAPTAGEMETVLTNLINSGHVTIVAARKDGTFANEADTFFAD